MITDNLAASREGAKAALLLRQQFGLPFERAICVWDLLMHHMRIEVLFVGRSSFTGLYVRDTPPRILVGARRPPGRKVFTGAHELGHHVFGHGIRADEYLADGEHDEAADPDEKLANAFARHLLMPAPAVRRAFSLRGWDARNPSPVHAYIIAEVLGVSYSALVMHLAYSIKCLPIAAAKGLLKVRPKDIQVELSPWAQLGRVVPVDMGWVDRPVDLEVGEVAILPAGAICPRELADVVGVGAESTTIVARAQGEGPLFARGWAGTLRVSRAQYEGRSCFRHLPDPDPDEEEADDT